MDIAQSGGCQTTGSQRIVAMALTALIHLIIVLIALFALWRSPAPLDREIFTAIDLSPAPPSAAQAEEAPPQPAPPQPQPTPSPAPPVVLLLPSELAPPPPAVPEAIQALLAEADSQGAGGACDLTGPVEAALRLDPDVQRLLPSIPPSRRSVAMAIALWNREWVAPDAGLDTVVLDAIRLTVATTIDAASDACRAQVQAGPRLVYLPGEIDTVLALGSGEWTWQDVVDTARSPSLEAADPAARLSSESLSRPLTPR